MTWSSPVHGGGGMAGVKWLPRSTLTSSSRDRAVQAAAAVAGECSRGVADPLRGTGGLQARVSVVSFGMTTCVM